LEKKNRQEKRMGKGHASLFSGAGEVRKGEGKRRERFWISAGTVPIFLLPGEERDRGRKKKGGETRPFFALTEGRKRKGGTEKRAEKKGREGERGAHRHSDALFREIGEGERW